MSGGLLCSQHNVCQEDHQGEQQPLQLANTSAAAATTSDQGAKALERALIQPTLAAMTNPGNLMPNPWSLYDMWNEYLHGVGGESLQGYSSKPSEGQVKLKYSRMKVIWDVIRNLVSLGPTALK